MVCRIFGWFWGLLLLAATVTAAGWWWIQQPLLLKEKSVEVHVPAGASLRTATTRVVKAGVQTWPVLLAWYFRIAGYGQTIKPGYYEVTQGMRPADLLAKLVRGDRIVLSVTLIEGWTFKQVRQALAKASFLRSETAGMSAEQIMTALGRPGVSAEGRFFPDTYHYEKYATDLSVLAQSMKLMDQRLQAAWQVRSPNLPLTSPEQALILASIVEKETARPQDRADIAAVFVNRLRNGMKLQTDPAVIYGLGDAFDGNLKRSHLITDTPYNSYTRNGLPPTPIAMPGKASLMAAVQPSNSKALYFVARGDGSSHFSYSLQEHNRAVNRYQRGGR